MSSISLGAYKMSAPHLVENLGDLSKIANDSYPAVLWQRQETPPFQAWLNGLNPALLPKIRLVIPKDNIRTVIEETFEKSSIPNCYERALFIQDIGILADTFAIIMKVPYLRLRLDVITTNACKKFHIDYLDARLICTYRGTGTQFGIAEDNEAEPQTISQAPTGAPMLMRGKKWPTQPNINFLHRSPPIAGTGEHRVVLVLDPIADIEVETTQNHRLN